MFKPKIDQIEEILKRGEEIVSKDDNNEDEHVKVQVSLRLPKNIVDKILEIAAQETLKSKRRVTATQIYCRALKQYIDSFKQ